MQRCNRKNGSLPRCDLPHALHSFSFPWVWFYRTSRSGRRFRWSWNNSKGTKCGDVKNGIRLLFAAKEGVKKGKEDEGNEEAKDIPSVLLRQRLSMLLSLGQLRTKLQAIDVGSMIHPTNFHH